MKTSLGDILFFILMPFVKLFFHIKLNMKVGVNELKGIREPVFIIGGHYTFEDPILAMFFNRTMIRFLGSDANVDVPWKRFVFKLFHVIPFARKRGDFRAIRAMKKTVDAGYSVGLYPEGGRNWDGVTESLIPATSKLAKLLGVPVYAIYFNGLHISNPRWAAIHRRGRVDVNIRCIITKDEIKSLSADEILDIMTDKLAYSEYDWQEKARVKFKGKRRAEYIERLLYKCSECGEMNSISSHGNDFECTKCGWKFGIDEYGLVVGSTKFCNVAQWNAWQRDYIVYDENAKLILKAIPIEVIDKGAIEKTIANVVLSTKGIAVTLKSDNRSIVQPLNRLEAIAPIYKDSLEWYYDGIKYRIKFLPGKHLSFVYFLEMLTLMVENSNKEGV